MAKDEARKLSTVQEVMLRRTDYLRRIIAPAGGQGGVTLSYLCPHCNSFPLEDYVWWTQLERSTTGAQSVEKNMSGERPTGYWWCNQAKVPIRQGLQSSCGTAGLVWKLDHCPQTVSEPAEEDGDSPIQSIVKGSRKKGLRNFITVDNHRALEVGHLREGSRSFVLVVDGRVLRQDHDRVISMRKRVLGGSRNVTPSPGEWTCPCCLRPGCWPTKNTCFRCGTARASALLPLVPFPRPVPKCDRFGNSSIQGDHMSRLPVVLPWRGELLRTSCSRLDLGAVLQFFLRHW